MQAVTINIEKKYKSSTIKVACRNDIAAQINLKFFITIVVILLLATACSGNEVFTERNFFAPKPLGMGGPAKGAPTEYKEGWDDGCTTGLSTMVQSYYKSFYQYRQNAHLAATSPMYYKAWKDAYTYCRQYSFRYSWDAIDKRLNKDYNPLCILCPNELDRTQ